MIEKKWYPVVYMFVVTAVFSSFVIGFTQSTAKRVEANEKLIFEQAVLAVMPRLYNPNLSGLEQHKIFVEKIKEPSAQTGGAFTFMEGDKIIAYAIPVEGQGFWAPIRAVVGIDADKKTITGFAVYQQNETPGLGAEIAKPEFRNQFKGKIISSEEKSLNINRPGTPLDQSSVHAITGATQTSVRLEKLINDGLKNWQQKIGMEAN
jgi:Na+-transporting NADH:ubiquinone oxidoreductase subunit C